MTTVNELSDGAEKRGEKGFALILVLAILMTLTVFGVGVLTSTGTNVALSRNFALSTQAMNMSETGSKVAYREFITSGFRKTTHKLNKAAKQTGDSLLTISLSNYTVESNGDFKWEWDSSKSYAPLWDTDKPHGFTFRVYYVSDFAFVIECEGWYGNIKRRIRAKGEVESLLQFSYFATRDLGEFAFDQTLTITGKVHANGNMYIKPSPGYVLNVNTSMLTATGHIIRSRDAWSRPDVDPSNTATVQITRDAQDSGVWVTMLPGSPRGSEGIAFDSYNPNWSHKTLGAIALWGGVVRDRVPYKTPPPIQNLDVGGLYDLSAGLHITGTTHVSKTWAQQKTFFNANEDRNVTVEEIDMKALMAAGDWPSNNIIYSNTPVRISNADSLRANLTFASNATIYTKGDFNTKNKKGAMIITKQRIYHLSGLWDDTKANGLLNLRVAKDTTINGGLVDGAPTVDEYAWADVNNDHIWDSGGYAMYDDWDHKTAAGFNNPYSASTSDPYYRYPNKSPSDNLVDAGGPWANMEDLLEDWGSMSPKKILTKFGSVINLSGGTMCPNLDNSGITAAQIAWVRKVGYWPPNYIYTYDPTLATPSGQPPLTPLIGHIHVWEPY